MNIASVPVADGQSRLPLALPEHGPGRRESAGTQHGAKTELFPDGCGSAHRSGALRRIWLIGGEHECPWSLAAILDAMNLPSGWEVLVSDGDAAHLLVSRAGSGGAAGGRVSAARRQLARRLHFVRVNLAVLLPPFAPFDLIVCGPRAQLQTDRLGRHLLPGAQVARYNGDIRSFDFSALLGLMPGR